jgi:hypothetical protein
MIIGEAGYYEAIEKVSIEHGMSLPLLHGVVGFLRRLLARCDRRDRRSSRRNSPYSQHCQLTLPVNHSSPVPTPIILGEIGDAPHVCFF